MVAPIDAFSSESVDDGLIDMQMLAPRDICALLKVSKRTLQDMIQRGDWPPPIRFTKKTVRWRRCDVERALRGEWS